VQTQITKSGYDSFYFFCNAFDMIIDIILDVVELTLIIYDLEEFLEAGNTWFHLPEAKIPEWFDHQCLAGLPISFWFRNKFPTISLCVVPPLTWYGSQHRVIAIINGNKFFYTHGSKICKTSQKDTYHLHLFHMQMKYFNDNMDKAVLENKWNHAEVDFGFPFMYSGIHVLEEKSNMNDIRFSNLENDANIVLRPGC